MTTDDLWHHLGLGGAEFQAAFTDLDHLRDCVVHLIEDQHGHHFAVVDEGRALVMSTHAVRCLVDAGLMEMEPQEITEVGHG